MTQILLKQMTSSIKTERFWSIFEYEFPIQMIVLDLLYLVLPVENFEP